MISLRPVGAIMSFMGRIEPLEIRRRRPVRFRMPTGQVITYRLIDEAAAQCEEDGADYRNLVQLLCHDGTGGEHVRMAYYRRPVGAGDEGWVFGSQTSLTLRREDWVNLLAEGLTKPWFQSIVEEAHARAHGSPAAAP
jgi:hypothetical protein